MGKKIRTAINAAKIAATAATTILLGVLVVVAVNSFDGSIFSKLAERIPGIKSFIVKTYPTGMYARSSRDIGALKLARYDIDFLASFTGAGGRYVALYPFSVEAEIPIDRASIDAKTGELALPAPRYFAALNEDRAAGTVFMDTLSLDWNQEIAPVLAMYREKSVDLALADEGFTDSVRARGAEFAKDLLGVASVRWVDVESNESKTEAFVSKRVPVAFSAQGDGGRTKFSEAPSYRDALVATTSRFDADGVASFRFGRAGTMLGSFDAFAAKFDSPSALRGRVRFRYHDPINPGAVTFVSFADDGYREAFVYARGSTAVYYVDASEAAEINAEGFAQSVAPALLYLAASARANGDDTPERKRYAEYWRAYENALSEIRASGGRIAPRRLGNAFDTALRDIERLETEWAGEGAAPSAELSLLRKLKGWDGDSERDGPDGFSAYELLRVAAESTELGGSVAATLWSMGEEIGLSPEQTEGLRRDLVSKGTAVSEKLLASLTPEERNELIGNFMRNRLNRNEPTAAYRDENGKNEEWLYYGKSALEWKAAAGQLKISERLAANGLGRGNEFVLVFAEREEKRGLFAKYDAITIDETRVGYYRNAGRWLGFLSTSDSTPISDVRVTEGAFTVGKISASERPEIAAALGAFAAAFRDPSYNRERVETLMRGNLRQQALEVLSRPEFP